MSSFRALLEHPTQHSAKSEKNNQEAVLISKQENNKTAVKKQPNELQQVILAFPGHRQNIYAWEKNYKISVLIGLNLTRIRPIVCAFDTVNGSNLIRGDVLQRTLQDCISESDVPDIYAASDTMLNVSGNMNPLLGMA